MSFRVFFLSLAVSALAFLAIFQALSGRHTGLGAGRGHASVASAVSRRQFPVVALGSRFAGQAIDPLSSPALVQSLFPGYPPEMQKDEALWSNYFSRDFEIKVTSAWLSENSLYGAGVFASWTGCLDIVKKYGADVVLIGASDLAQGLPPDELAKHFRRLRVLVCASPSLTPDAITSFLASLKDASRGHSVENRPKLVVVALSATLAYRASIYYPAIDHVKKGLLLGYRQREFLSELGFLDHPVTSPISWNDILPIRRSVSHLPLPARLERRVRGAPPERWSVLTTTFPKSALKDPSEMARLRRDFSPPPYFFRDMNDSDCARLSELPKMLADLKTAALATADNVFLTLTPTTGDELLEAPRCYLPLLTSTLESLNDLRAWVLTKDLPTLGLDNADFVFVDDPSRPDLLRLDFAHLNIFGGRKYAAMIARELRSHGFPREPSR